MDFTALWLTFKLASVVTFILLVLCIPFVYFLHFKAGKLKKLIETCVNMPLVLPPTVLGFYLLLAFGNQSMFGKWFAFLFNTSFVFSFEGIVLASLIYSLPFMINPVYNALQSLPKEYTEASYTMGKTSWHTFLHVLLPNIYSALWVGTIMTFAHTVGEFGVVLMIGGSIPGVTQVASIAIYNEVEQLNYSSAHTLSFILFSFSFLVLLLAHLIKRPRLL